MTQGQRRALLGLVGVVAVALAVSAVLWPASRDARPNVLLVVWDTVRADRMSLYGHSRDTTPFLERFAKEAVVYEHAIASSEWTGPTHASLFTGLPLRTHGMDTHYKWLDQHYVTLAEQLSDAGYDTWAFTGNRFVSDFVNMLQGFGVQDHTFRGRYKAAARKATARKLIPRDRSTEISPAWAPDGHGDGWSKKLTLFKDAAPVAQRAFDHWLDEEHDRSAPFFAFVNLMEAHQPRVPSLQSRRALLDEASIQLALDTDSSLFALMSFMSGKHAYTRPELDAMAGTYDAAILDLDRAFEQMMGDLERRGLLDDTIVILTADHGEMLGEKGLYSHRWALYEPLVRVPLIVRYPKGMRPARIATTVSVASVPATVLELAGAPPLPGVAPSLVADPEPRLIFSELRDPNEVMPVVRRAFPDLPADQFQRSLHAVFDGSHKLVRASDHRHELYDLANDPEEVHNLADGDPTTRERLLEALRAWEAATPAYDPANRQPDDNAKQLADPETRRMLEILGYTADEGDER
ncbi:MAG: sulfatase-like hydrolase/transferase [Alphaproteobacteria bacterium]|nr:sulfatase-like hydrolase/transferase [Alphaproteobacteria bacterium]